MSPPRRNPTPITKKPIRAKRWFGNGFVLNRYVMVLPVNEANIAAAPRANQMNVATRSTQVGIYTISRLSAPGSRVIVQAGPAQIRRVQNLSGKQTSIWAADLAKPAEVHFSTGLQVQQLFASVSRGEVDFTPALHPLR
jgi:hypothetical protein